MYDARHRDERQNLLIDILGQRIVLAFVNNGQLHLQARKSKKRDALFGYFLTTLASNNRFSVRLPDMDDQDPSYQKTRARPQSPASTLSASGLDLTRLPPVAIFAAHLKDDEQKKLKNALRQYDAPLTTDMSKAKIFIGKVGTERRAEFELRSRKLVVEEIIAPKRPASPAKMNSHPNKRQRLSRSAGGPGEGDSTTEDETGDASKTNNEASNEKQFTPSSSPLRSDRDTLPALIFENTSNDDVIWVIKSDWVEVCIAADHLVPLGDYLVYKGRVRERPKSSNIKSIKDIFSVAPKQAPVSQRLLPTRPHRAQDILDRTKSDAVATLKKNTYQPPRFGSKVSRRFEGKSFAASSQPTTHSYASQAAHLLQQTTSEYEGENSDFPLPPEWVKQGVKYACQRFTPGNGPNEDFLDQLKKIRTARTLIDDEIGVRAYSTIIASIAAYPFKLSHPREIAQLPGCDEKTAALFVEWKNTGKIQGVEEYEHDEAMKVLRSFYDIWGVGAKTARQFYYNNHWTELDDIIEYGWNDLDRVQQIGVKYYDEFQEPIPRAEVEHIAAVVREHAVRLRDERITVTIVGGYRRGKEASGDVDMIVSHPELDKTAGLVQEIVELLEDAECITHVLTLSLKNTNRGQHALPFRSTKAAGAGFDTLDKALVVWQDSAWPTREQDLEESPRAKNPAIHRRVDIIVSPWRTVGCAVMGWSGGTTFQRDLRRYAKAVKDWKFDSSGIRSRIDGEAVLLEGPDGVAGTPEDAEKKVFEGLGLEYVPPEYRVTY
ncbi:terminal deoxynucleotidyl transferase [Stemphylium lycopersici]|uniref:DNA-directed DNA polymerase n=1 Tax=Stemphylium lycopersici TaxID=183478 RepID=A0A364MXG5_STELY|nr:dna polymerase beta-like protein [Stemphylium lycopersici]RAR00663.1 terminal deoxynucleotidyl transferase [Stemphylium lycopersici]RAR06448.1 terminal deoxynucleotidyl transferase [Stemphylium lycopersici]